jgi:hypothetical protein
VVCGNDQFKPGHNNNTACSQLTTQSDCSTDEKYVQEAQYDTQGSQKLYYSDNRCEQCATGQWRNTPTTCAERTSRCPDGGEYFVPSAPTDSRVADAQCTACPNGYFVTPEQGGLA